MIRINLLNSDTLFEAFCRMCRAYFGLTARHCDISCPGCGMRFCQQRMKEGLTIKEAFEEWVARPVSHKAGEEILCDYMGVESLDTVREILKEGKNDE